MFFESGSSSSSSSSRSEWTYDVFLSFRGEDTRKNFTDHLYTALVQAGINTFRDDDELPRGQEISSQLRKAIKESRISIVVFSKGYASSRWCLDELIEILECKNRNEDQVVIPIFYDIDPSDVRNRKRSFAEAFERHEERFKEQIDKVNEWKEALLKAGSLSGWNLKDMADGHEAKFIRNIVQDVSKRLDREYLHVSQKRVGIDSRADKIIAMLKMYTRSGVLVVGIHGMAGIGKTTVAKAVFNKICHRFEGSCFLLNVKETSEQPNGWVQLLDQILWDILKTNIQKIRNIDRGINLIKERLRHKRVLFVIDDLDQLKPLDALVRERNWFAPGSRIIITTKNERLLTQLEVDEMFQVKSMDQQESLQLFSWHAFRDAQPAKDFMELSSSIVDYCGGLPLALEVLGSSLFKKSKHEWENHIDQLKRIPDNEIQKKLKISYDTLGPDVQNTFLDIACFLIGKEKEYAAKIIEARFDDLNPEFGFNTLSERCLLTINFENELRMHDLLRDMGREIVRQTSPQHPGKRSRIWLRKDAWNVLKKQRGTETVEGLALDVRAPEVVSLNTVSFINMRYLQLLQINGVQLIGSYEYLSKELLWLCWLECPLKSLPSSFRLDNLVVLDMQHNKLTELWKETKTLNRLKILNLSHSKCLSKMPNFLELSNLERLILEDCPSLTEVHQSIGHLSKLVSLNLEGCCRLRNLPESICDLKSLETLNLNMCSQLGKLPDRLGNMESLIELLADETAITQLPSSIGNLKNLRNLSLSGCSNGLDLPSTSWLSLISSWVSPRSSSSKALLPASLSCLRSLQRLNLSHCGLSESEISIIDLGSLYSLRFLDLSGNQFFNLPSGIGRLSKLCTLLVNRCNNLLSIPEIPSSLQGLDACDCTSMEMVSFSSETRPRMNAAGCRNLMEIQGIEGGPNSWHFALAECNNLPDNFKKILVQACGEDYDIVMVGGEIPEWFNHRGEGSSVSFQIPNAVSDGRLHALVLWAVCTGNEEERTEGRCGEAVITNKTNGSRLMERTVGLVFNRNYGHHCWVSHMTLTGLPFRIEGGDELELLVRLDREVFKVERCGVHLMLQKPDAAADIVDSERQSVSVSGCTEAQWKNCLTRELQQCLQICSMSSDFDVCYTIGSEIYTWVRRDGEGNNYHRVESTHLWVWLA